MLNIHMAYLTPLSNNGSAQYYQLTTIFSGSIENVSSDVLDVIARIPDVRDYGVCEDTLHAYGYFRDVEATLRFVVAAFKAADVIPTEETAEIMNLDVRRLLAV